MDIKTSTAQAPVTSFPLPPGPMQGPAAWYGPELAKRDDWIFRFTPADLAEIEQVVAGYQASGLPLTQISKETFPLPQLGARLAQVLHELLHGRGFVLMRGLQPGRWSREQTAVAYLGLGAHFGAPRSQNAKGHLLGHVKDLGLDVKDGKVRYYQTSRRLEYHTDSVDMVGLLCLKTSKEGGESYIVSSITLYNEILRRRPDLLPLLFQPFPTDRRGEVPEGMLPWFDMPVFHWHEGQLSATYSREYIESAQVNFPQARRLSAQEREALELLTQLANDPEMHLSMEFQPGDIQLLHNHQVLHSRGDFVNWPEPERHRHLLRLWLCPREGRPLPGIVAARYGSVEIGDRGGIIVPGTRLKVPLEAE
jgi:hypothetical protein